MSCTDNALVRAEVAYAARALEIPMIDAGVYGSAKAGGRVAHYPAGDQAACYLCALGEARRAELLSYGWSASLGCHLNNEVAMGDDAQVAPTWMVTKRSRRDVQRQETKMQK